MSRLLDTFGRVATNPVAQIERNRLDRWATDLIRAVRSGRHRADPHSVLADMADLHDENGALVDDRTAAVELQNLTRPTMAVARFAAFAAVALTEHPAWADRIREAASAAGRLTEIPDAVAFAQEVRRVHPFVPMLPALATTDFEVQGCPGGKIAVAALSAAVAALCRPEVRVSRDPDDLTFPWTEMLTRPATGVRVAWQERSAATA